MVVEMTRWNTLSVTREKREAVCNPVNVLAVQGVERVVSRNLIIGLLFRVLAPMRNRDKMRKVAEGIEAMAREEAAYWLGMAIHRAHPRRVLSALRMLLTDPSRQT